MKQPISGFTQDDEGHWVALLACGHRQHMRHDPPFLKRPWVTSKEGRESRIGQEVECLECDRTQPAETETTGRVS